MPVSGESPLPSLEGLRLKIVYLMDRRAISHGRLAARVREAHPDLTLNQSTISRFINGSDLSYGLAFRIWNVLLDLQSIASNKTIQDAMVPKQRIVYASPEMTIGEFLTSLASQDFDFAPYLVKGKIVGTLDVRLAHSNVRPFSETTPLNEVVQVAPETLLPAPHSYKKMETLRTVQAAMERAIKTDRSRALGLVKDGKRLVGLITPYNFIGVHE